MPSHVRSKRMKNALASIFIASFFLAPAFAQESLFQKLEIITTLQRPPVVVKGFEMPSSRIKDFQVFDSNSGAVYTQDAVFFTDDGGETWQTFAVGRRPSQRISSVFFESKLKGIVILFDVLSAETEIAKTSDGGDTWIKQILTLENAAAFELDLTDASLYGNLSGHLELSVRIPTSSNFTGRAVYRSNDGGLIWEFISRSIETRTDDEAYAITQKENWTLETSGECVGFKTGCVQETRVFISGKDVTPSALKEITSREKAKATKESADTPMFAAPPGGSTRISLHRGFDKCTAAPASQMQTWWDASYFQDSNIYISGRNRGCTQGQLTSTWVNQVSAMGWGLIPTIVGYQSPCSVCTSCAKHSSDSATAETQGRGEADIAIADANNLGLTTGTVLYYDMERYDETAQTPNCRVSTTAFLKGWTDRLHELGYISGTYGSPTNAVNDWIGIPGSSRMDAVWLARWDNVMSVWTYNSPSPVVPMNVWNIHQRIKQWQAPHNETWGGVTFNIDGNIADGPVAGILRPKNKNADFDGDGKSDVSVYRPETGAWYVLNSANFTFTVVGFGLSTDVITPGDYDGDGKTDFAVFRPSDGFWHTLGKGGLYAARGFGTTGDIPVSADFNGDGKTDIAVFRPSTGVWYIANSDSLGTFSIVQFGFAGDKPAQADYDGDGKADIAVFRPSNGDWYVLRSSDGGFTIVQFGLSGDLPAQADYDGDGRADFAVLRDGLWYLLQTTAGFAAVQFGLAGDVPSTGDFDGDGKADIVVFRPSSGVWYLLQSQNGFGAVQFGISTDRTVPNAYLPQ